MIYIPPKKDYLKRRKSLAIPDQSLSIQEIVKRYVRGIPVDVIQREAVYSDQNDHDLEQLSRMDFGEKSEFANMLADEAAELKQGVIDRQNAKANADAKADQEAKASAKAAKSDKQAKKGQPSDDQDGVN